MTDFIVWLRWMTLRRPTQAQWMVWYSAYLNTSHWRKFSKWKRDGQCCIECGSRASLQVHHKRYDILWREHWPWNWSGTEVLCEECHGKKK